MASSEEDKMILDAVEDMSPIKAGNDYETESSSSSKQDNDLTADIDSDDMIDCEIINNFESLEHLIFSIEQAQELEMDAIKM